MTPTLLPWTPTCVAPLAEPDPEGWQIVLLRGKAVARVRVVQRCLLLQAADSTHFDGVDGPSTHWRDTAQFLDIAPKRLPLPERLAFALDQAIGVGAHHLEQALLGWAESVREEPTTAAANAHVQIHIERLHEDTSPFSEAMGLRLLSAAGTLASERPPKMLLLRISGLAERKNLRLVPLSRISWTPATAHAKIQRLAAWQALLRQFGGHA